MSVKVPLKQVAHDRLIKAGYTKHAGAEGYYSKYPESGRFKAAVVLKNKHTLDVFAGYPQQVCAILVQDGCSFPLVSQDFYDLNGGI